MLSQSEINKIREATHKGNAILEIIEARKNEQNKESFNEKQD